ARARRGAHAGRDRDADSDGDAAPGVEADRSAMMETNSKPRVLIVEDHPLIAELVETRLRIEGMMPTKCAGGREALAALSAEQYDAVILDIMMPDVDGYEVLRSIRATSLTATLPVIFLTAKSSPADVEKGLALGANHYITKPFSGQDLMRKLRLCLAERKIVSTDSPAVG